MIREGINLKIANFIILCGIVLISCSLFLLYQMLTVKPTFRGYVHDEGSAVRISGIITSNKYLIKEADVEVVIKTKDGNIK